MSLPPFSTPREEPDLLDAVSDEEEIERLRDRQKQEIRVECNMEEFPYFRLSKRDSKTFNKIHYAREVRNQEGGAIKQRWTVVADSELGLPGPFDQDVYVALEAIIDEVGIHAEGYVPFTRYRIAQLLGKDHSGRTYQNIRTAIMRMVSTRITSEKAFYLREEKIYISETFHLYDSVRFEERSNPKRSKAAFEYNLLFPCRWYVASRRQNYTKPLDLNLYKALKSPAAKKIFRLLDKRRHSNPKQVQIDLFRLADALPLTPGFPSKLKQVLEEPHEQLRQVGFLKDIEYFQPPGSSGLRIFYTFPKEIPAAAEAAPRNPLAQMLINRALSANVAEFLAKQYAGRIPKQVEVFDWLIATKSPQVKHNPAGFLRRSIEDDYTAPHGFMTETERKAAVEEGLKETLKRRDEDEAEADAQRKLKMQIEQAKANLPPDELDRLRREAEEHLSQFLKQRYQREKSLGFIGDSTQAAIEFELDRVIENRYLNLPGVGGE